MNNVQEIIFIARFDMFCTLQNLFSEMILLAGLYQYESLRTLRDSTYICNIIESAQYLWTQEIYEDKKVVEVTGATDKM
jgi:hypothetical protein